MPLMLQQLLCRTSKHIGANPSCVKGKPAFCTEESPLFSPERFMFGVKPDRHQCGQAILLLQAGVKQWRQPTWTCYCRPTPSLGGHGKRICELTAGGRFASLQAPKEEGAQPGSCRMGKSGLCHPQQWTIMLGTPLSLFLQPKKRGWLLEAALPLAWLSTTQFLGKAKNGRLQP